MTDNEMCRKRLQKEFDDSDMYYVHVGDSWVACFGETEVKLTQIGGLVRASVGTGVLV